MSLQPDYYRLEKTELSAANELLKEFHKKRTGQRIITLTLSAFAMVSPHFIDSAARGQGIDVHPQRILSDEQIAKMRREELASIDAQYRDLRHAVFNILPHEHIPSEKLTSANIRKFAALREPPTLYAYYDYLFDAEEKSAVSRIKTLMTDKNKAQIENLAGMPSYEASKIDCWPTSLKYQLTWVYFFGPQMLPLAVYFNGDKCAATSVPSRKERYEYGEWLCTKLEKIAIGLKPQNLESILGIHGFDIENAAGGKLEARDIAKAASISYQVSLSYKMRFSFDNLRCISATSSLYAH